MDAMSDRPFSMSAKASNSSGSKTWFSGFVAAEWEVDRAACLRRIETWCDSIFGGEPMNGHMHSMTESSVNEVATTLYALYVEVSDKYGTAEFAGVFSTRTLATEAEASIRDRRTFIREIPLNSIIKSGQHEAFIRRMAMAQAGISQLSFGNICAYITQNHPEMGPVEIVEIGAAIAQITCATRPPIELQSWLNDRRVIGSAYQWVWPDGSLWTPPLLIERP
jgi:hypothetical protein